MARPNPNVAPAAGLRRRRMSGLGLSLRSHDVQVPRTPPSLAASFEWHLEGFDCTIPGATSPAELSPLQDAVHPVPAPAPECPAAAPGDIDHAALPGSSDHAFRPSSDPSWQPRVPSNATISDGQDNAYSPRAHRSLGLALNLHCPSSEHPPSILARPSSHKSITPTVHPRFNEVRRPRIHTRRAVSDYAGSQGTASRPSSPGMYSRSRSMAMGGAREGAAILSSSESRRRRAMTTGPAGPSIRFADRPIPPEPNGRVQFVASGSSLRHASRPVNRALTAGANSPTRLTRRRTLQFADTPHDRIEWHERDMRPQCSTSSEHRTLSTGDARSHPASSLTKSSVVGSRSAGSSPWVRPALRLQEAALSDSDADANCIFMEGLESLAALEEKQTLQDQRLRAWRARTGSGSSDLVWGRPSAESGISLRQQRAALEAMLADAEQPVEDDSDYQAQTESVPSGAAVDPASNSSDGSDHEHTSDSGSGNEGLNEDGHMSTSGSPGSLSLARIRSAGTPPPSTLRSGSSASLPSPRLGRPKRQSWNAQTKIDLNRADFGPAAFLCQALRRTTSVPPKLALGAAPTSETVRPRHLRFMSPPRMQDPPSPPAVAPSVASTVASTSGKALVKSPSPIASPSFGIGLLSSPQPSPKPILRNSFCVSRPTSSVSIRTGSGPIPPRPRPPVRQPTVHLSSPFLAPVDPDESGSTDEPGSSDGSHLSPSDEEEDDSSEADEGVYRHFGWSPRSSRGVVSASTFSPPHGLQRGESGRISFPGSRSPCWDPADARRSPRRLTLDPPQRAGPRLQVKPDGTTQILPRLRALSLSDSPALPAMTASKTLPRSRTQHPPTASTVTLSPKPPPLTSPLVRPQHRLHPGSAPLTPRLSSGLGLAAHSPPALPSVAATQVQAAGQVYSPISPLGLAGAAPTNPTLEDFMDWSLLLPAPVAPFHHNDNSYSSHPTHARS